MSLEARSGAAPDRADQGTRWMGDPWTEERVPYLVVNCAGTSPNLLHRARRTPLQRPLMAMNGQVAVLAH